MTFQPANNRTLLLIVMPCLLLVIQEMPRFNARWVADESWYSMPAANLIKEGSLRNPTFAEADSEAIVDTRPPAMPLTLASSFSLLGVGISQARIPALLAGILTVITTYFLGAELLSPLAGALSALLLAADNFFFLASRTARPEVFVTLFSTLAILLYIRGRRSPARWITFTSGLAAGIAILFHVCGVAVAACLGGLLCVEFGTRWHRTPRLWFYVLGILLATTPEILWFNIDQKHRTAAEDMYSRGAGMSAGEKLQAEATRYEDLFGIGSMRFALPWHIPFRAHVVAASIAALALLFRRRPRLGVMLIVLLLANLVGWIYLVNKTSRYFAIIAPLLAIALAALPLFCAGRRRSLAWALVAIVGASEIAGNLLYLRQASQANYERLATELVRTIPTDRPVYGAITFWMALRDRQFYSYARTPLPYAVDELHSFYLIANDRILEQGSGYGNDDYAGLRSAVDSLIRSGDRAQLIERVPDPFYGDLHIYLVRPLYSSALASAPSYRN